MMMEIKFDSYIVRYSEIALKKKNRSFFERKLIDNIKRQAYFQKKVIKNVKRPRGRVIFESKDEVDLTKVFGISSYSRAVKADLEMEKIKKMSQKFIINMKEKDSFRISCQRLNKKFRKLSPEVENEIGKFVHEKSGKKVRLKDPDYELMIEIIDENAYLSDHKIRAHAGLPYGVEGALFALIEDEKSVLASWMMMKRGCKIIPFAKDKKDHEKQMAILQKYSPEILDLKRINKFDDLDDLKKRFKINAIVTGHTLEDKKNLDTVLVNFSPLIFMDKKEISNKLDEIK